MYKWQLQSAIGRGGPTSGSISRVADGIASTLRAFSISARQCEEGGPKITRAEGSQRASREISSLPRAVDARSLAAQPSNAAPKLVIRRVDPSSRGGRGSSSAQGAGGFRGRGGLSSGGLRGRGNARGGAGMRGRGGRGGGRGSRTAKGSKRGARRATDSGEVLEEPLSEEEMEYLRVQTFGLPQVYEAGSKTTDQGLKGGRSPLALTSDGTRGLQETIQDQLNIYARRHPDQYINQEELVRQYAAGKAIVFTSEEEKKAVMKYWAARRQLTSQATGKEYKPPVLNGLNEIEKATMLQTLTAGQYEALKDIGKGDIMAGIENYTQRNETYRFNDKTDLMSKIRTLLPVAKPAVAAKGAATGAKPAPKPAAKK